jgi:uncharacterized membrane protein
MQSWYHLVELDGMGDMCLNFDLYLAREQERRNLVMAKNMSTAAESHTFLNVRQLTLSGILAGITIFLGLTGYGFIPLIVMNATILHIPTIIGGITGGPKVGAMVGLMFGLFSFIQTFRAPSLMMQFAQQYNVIYDFIICVAPRVFIGILAWWIYQHMPGRETIRAGLSAIITTFCHTVLFLGTFFLLVGAPYAAQQQISTSAVGALLGGIAVTSGIPEALVAGAIVAPIIVALKKAGFKM